MMPDFFQSKFFDKMSSSADNGLSIWTTKNASCCGQKLRMLVTGCGRLWSVFVMSLKFEVQRENIMAHYSCCKNSSPARSPRHPNSIFLRVVLQIMASLFGLQKMHVVVKSCGHRMWSLGQYL